MTKRTLTPAEREEAAALKLLFDTKKRELKLSQGRVADAMGISQSSINHYLNGTNALNLPAAVSFSELLQVPVAAFSPRLAQELQRYARAAEAQYIEPVGPFVALTMATDATATSPIRFSLTTLLENGLKPITASAYIVPDDSMAPELAEGTLIILDTTKTQLTTGEVFLISTPAGHILRRATLELDGNWILRTVNPNKARWPDSPVPPAIMASLKILGQLTPMQLKPLT